MAVKCISSDQPVKIAEDVFIAFGSRAFFCQIVAQKARVELGAFASPATHTLNRALSSFQLLLRWSCS